MDWENHLEKKSDPKHRKKNSKNQSEIAACEQKTTTEKPNFCSNTLFSLYFKIRMTKFKLQNHSLFRSISCFGVTNLTSKIMKMCEQILKKHSRKNSRNDLKEKIAHTYD